MGVPTCRKLVWLHVSATFTSHFSFVSSFNLTHEIHLWYLCLYIWLICMVCVGRDTITWILWVMKWLCPVWMWICSIAKAVGEGQGQQEMQQQQDTQAQQHPPGPVKQMSQQKLPDQQVEQEAEKYVQRLGDFYIGMWRTRTVSLDTPIVIWMNHCLNSECPP